MMKCEISRKKGTKIIGITGRLSEILNDYANLVGALCDAMHNQGIPEGAVREMITEVTKMVMDRREAKQNEATQ